MRNHRLLLPSNTETAYAMEENNGVLRPPKHSLSSRASDGSLGQLKNSLGWVCSPAGSTDQGVAQEQMWHSRVTVSHGSPRRPGGHKRHIVGSGGRRHRSGSVSRPWDGNANALLGGDKGSVFAEGARPAKRPTRGERAKSSAWGQPAAAARQRNRRILKNSAPSFFSFKFKKSVLIWEESDPALYLAELFLRTGKKYAKYTLDTNKEYNLVFHGNYLFRFFYSAGVDPGLCLSHF